MNFQRYIEFKPNLELNIGIYIFKMAIGPNLRNSGRELGWRARISLRDGLAAAYADFLGRDKGR